jgi:hypothetical protein
VDVDVEELPWAYIEWGNRKQKIFGVRTMNN